MPSLLLTFQHRNTTSEFASNITTNPNSANLTNAIVDPRDSCTLSHEARAFSTLLTAVVGSILIGLSNGYFAAFITAWVCWLATLRILIVGTYYTVRACQLQPLRGGEDFFDFIRAGHGFGGIRASNHGFIRHGAGRTAPTVLGWISWFYSCCYAPVIQVLWLVENWSKADSGLKITRAVAASVAAVPSTMDTKARYGDKMGERFGSHFAIAFTFVTAASTLLLGLIAVIELSLAAHQGDLFPGLIVGYVVFTMLWTYLSFISASPHDESMDMKSFRNVLAGLGMALFCSFFCSSTGVGDLAGPSGSAWCWTGAVSAV